MFVTSLDGIKLRATGIPTKIRSSFISIPAVRHIYWYQDSFLSFAVTALFIFNKFVNCCVPFNTTTETEQYNGDANVTSCGVPDCAASYYEDLAFALNNVDDSILGCTSGITVVIDAFIFV
jgi:hypothetical protein